MADCLPQCNEADVGMGDFPFSSVSECPLEFCCEKLVIKIERVRRGGICHLGCDLLLIKLQCDTSFMSGDS